MYTRICRDDHRAVVHRQERITVRYQAIQEFIELIPDPRSLTPAQYGNSRARLLSQLS
jgi:hypothetical protein